LKIYRVRTRNIILLFLILLGSTNSTPFSRISKFNEEKHIVFRVSADYVQIDVSVLDKDGRPVTGLSPADFEVFENGQPRRITHLTSVEAPGPPGWALASDGILRTGRLPDASDDPGLVPVGHTLVLVVDDRGLSFHSIQPVKRALEKFVKEMMQPGDLAAVICTGTSLQALHPFTGDREALLAAIDGLRFNHRSRAGIDASLTGCAPGSWTCPPGGGVVSTVPGMDPIYAEAEYHRYYTEVSVLGTMATLGTVVDDLRGVPGRKTLVLFSDGFPFALSEKEGYLRYLDDYHRLVDRANHAGVRIYTVDARGQFYTGLRAATPTNRHDFARAMSSQNQGRVGRVYSPPTTRYESGLHALADDTGGLFLHGSNDLSRHVAQVLDDQQAYYLLAYAPHPDAFTLQGKYPRYNEIEVKVRRDDVQVRHRQGYFGIPEATRRGEADPSPQVRLLQAAVRPLRLNRLGLRLDTQVIQAPDRKQFAIRADVFLKRSALAYRPEDDAVRTHLYMLAVLLDKKGKVLEQRESKYLLGMKHSAPPAAGDREWQLDYLAVVEKTGVYQVRVAVCDETSGLTDAAAAFVDVRKK